MVAASGTLMLVGGTGAVLGPVAVSLLMRQMWPVGFFACVAAVHTAIGVFALSRLTRRAPLPLEEQSAHVPGPSADVTTTAHQHTGRGSCMEWVGHRELNSGEAVYI